jgi:integrase
MADASVRRRGHGEDAIYFAADKNRYIGAVSLGFGPDGRRLRRKVSGKTKQEVRDKLKALRAELDVGLQPVAGYTVRAAVDAWLEQGLPGRSARTVQLYRDGVRPLTDRLGARPLRKLSAADVRSALADLSGQMSTRSLQIAHNSLVRAIRHAEADDLVGRNVAALVQPRHTFVSIMSADGVPVEEIARVAGHKQTSTTELVYRRELRPVITTGAQVMDKVFARQPDKAL